MLMVSLYFLFSNHVEDYFYAQSSQKNSETIGEIVSYENDIRVKNRNSIAWKKVNKKISLQTGDGIFTGPQSNTKVKMNEGDVIDVQQNTMVVFAKSQGKQVANLLQGTFKLSVQKSMKIKIKGKETVIHAENSKVEITVDKNKDSAPVVKVLEGQASITNSENKTIEIAENQTVELEKPTVEEQVEPPPEEQVIALPPEPHIWVNTQASQTILNGDEKIVLGYTKKNDFEQVLLEISKDSSFKDSTVISQWHPNTGSIITQVKDPGVYFLRLQSADPQTTLVSISDNMALVVLRPNLPVAPVPITREITLEQEEKTKIEWSPGENAVRYQYTMISKDGEEITKITDQRSFEWTAEELGPQFITLKSIDGYKRISPSTERIKITVLPKTIPLQRQIALSETEIRYDVQDVSSHKNRSYTKSFVEMEAATATMFSKEILVRGGGGAIATMAGIRVRHWIDFDYGFEGFLRTKLISVNAENGQPSPIELEGRANFRTHTDFNPFSSLRKSQFKFFAGAHIYRNSGSKDYSPQYQLVKVGGGFLFPIGTQFETSGEISMGMGTDQSKRYDASGQFLWYMLNDFSTGLGYRVYLFEAGSPSSSPRGVPYREGAVEVLYMLRYRY